jgi:hypothetical protein
MANSIDRLAAHHEVGHAVVSVAFAVSFKMV